MKKLLTLLALTATVGVASAQTYATNDVPGGQFNPTDPSYSEITNSSVPPAGYGGGAFVIDYPTSGGNPGGYARIANTDGAGWGVWVIGDVTPVSLASLGLTPGIPCTFLMDIKTEGGANNGGLKLESWQGLTKLNQSPEVKPAGSNDWVTYSFPYTPDLNADGLKIVGLWGAGSTNAFDNVRVIATTSLPLTATITAPAAAANVNTNFTINATALVLPGSVTNVNFYRAGTTLLGSDTNAPYSLAVVGAAEGPATLTVVAQDDNGNSVTSAPVNVTVVGAIVETIVKVDPSKSWLGYMNAFWRPNLGGALDFRGSWAVADLSAAFSGVGPASVLTLKPNPLNDPVAYWYDPPIGPGAAGTHDMEASMYVEIPAGQVNGNLVTFMGTCVTNTLVNPAATNAIGYGWTNYAFIKDFAPDYSSFTGTNIALTSGVPFSISLLTDGNAARHIQYGFTTRGPNVLPSDVNNYGSVVIQSLDASPTNVYVNSSSSWSGFMNVFSQDGMGYQFGSGWGTADLTAVFNGSGLVLGPNTIGDPDPYWYVGGGAPGNPGNKTMDASMYIEFPTNTMAGRKLIFSGNVLSNTLVSASNTNSLGRGWTSVAFIKDFAPDYSSVNSVTVPLTPGAFSINLTTVNDPARHVQYGFETVGPNVWVTDAAPFGKVVIGNVGVLPTSITPSLSGGNINLSFPTQLGKAYTVQYKNSLTNTSWSTLTTTNGTGANTVISDPSGAGQRYYRLSVQ